MRHTKNMRNLRTFESFSVNEELFGMDLMGKLRGWLSNQDSEVKNILNKVNQFLSSNPTVYEPIAQSLMGLPQGKLDKLTSFVQSMSGSDVQEIEQKVSESARFRKYESATADSLLKKVISGITWLTGGVTLGYGFINLMIDLMNKVEFYAGKVGGGLMTVLQSLDPSNAIAVVIGVVLLVLGYALGYLRKF